MYLFTVLARILAVFLVLFNLQPQAASITGSTRRSPAIDTILVGLLRIEQDLPEDTSDFVESLEAFCKNQAIKAVLVFIDSVGGSTAGTYRLVQALATCKNKKPLVAFIPDIALSAAYWLASMCDAIVATPTALIGNIGILLERQELSNRCIIHENFSYFSTSKSLFSPARSEHATSDLIAKKLNFDYSIVKESIMSSRFASQENKLSEKQMLWAEGLIFTGTQAHRLNLIDYLGSYTIVLKVITGLIQKQNIPVFVSPKLLLLTDGS